MASPTESPNPSSELDKSLLRLMADQFREMWRSGGIRKVIRFLLLLLKEAVFSKAFLISLLCGAGIGLFLALGQSYAIGFSVAWKIYGRWWLMSPLFGPFVLAATGVGFVAASELEHRASLQPREIKKLIIGSVLVIGLAIPGVRATVL